MKLMQPSYWRAGLLTATLAATRCLGAEAVVPTSQSEMPALVQLYETDRGSVSRFYDLPWSDTRFDRLDKLNKAWQQRLRSAEFNRLNQQERIDYLLLRNEIDAELSRTAREQRWLADMQGLLAFAPEIQRLEQERWTNRPVVPPDVAAKIAAIPDAVKKLRERLEAGRKEKDKKAEESKGSADTAPIKVSPVIARRAAEAASEIRGTLRRWFEFYDR